MNNRFLVAVLISILIHVVLMFLILNFTAPIKLDDQSASKTIDAFIVILPAKKPEIRADQTPEIDTPEISQEKSVSLTPEPPNAIAPVDSPKEATQDTVVDEVLTSEIVEQKMENSVENATGFAPYEAVSKYMTKQNTEAVRSLSGEALQGFRSSTGLSKNYVKPRESIQEVARTQYSMTYKVKGAFGDLCVTRKGDDDGTFGKNMSVHSCGTRKKREAEAYDEAMKKWGLKEKEQHGNLMLRR